MQVKLYPRSLLSKSPWRSQFRSAKVWSSCLGKILILGSPRERVYRALEKWMTSVRRSRAREVQELHVAEKWEAFGFSQTTSANLHSSTDKFERACSEPNFHETPQYNADCPWNELSAQTKWSYWFLHPVATCWCVANCNAWLRANWDCVEFIESIRGWPSSEPLLLSRLCE